MIYTGTDPIFTDDMQIVNKMYVDQAVEQSFGMDIDRTGEHQSFTAGGAGDGKTEIYIDDTSVRIGYPNDITQPQIDLDMDHLYIRQGGNGAEISVGATLSPMKYTDNEPTFTEDMQIPHKRYVDDAIVEGVLATPFDPNTMIRVNNNLGVAHDFVIPADVNQTFTADDVRLQINNIGITTFGNVVANNHITDTDDTPFQDQHLVTAEHVNNTLATAMDGFQIRVVNALPAVPDEGIIYFIKET